MFSQAVRALRVPAISVPGQTPRAFTHPAHSPGPHFSPAQGCQSLHHICHSRTSPWPYVLDSPWTCAVATFPDLSPALPGWTLDMSHYLTLSRTVDEPFPITTPVLLNFGLVSKVTFPACARVALAQLLAHLPLRSRSAIASP